MRINRCFLALASLLLAATAHAAPLRILFVGNSLTASNNMPAMIGRIASLDHRDVRITLLAHPNFALEDHLATREFRRTLLGTPWDFVVLQQGPSSLDESRRLLVRDTRAIAQLLAGTSTRIALLMVWPATDDAATWARVAASYRAAADAVGGIVIAAGEQLREQRNLPLLGADGFHPSAEGSFFVALLAYRALVAPVPEATGGMAISERIAGAPLRLSATARKRLVDAANR